MDCLTSRIPLSWLIFLVLIVIGVLRKRFKTQESGKNSLPPGPGAWPVIGNLHQLLDKQPLHMTLKALADRHGEGGVMSLKLGSVGAVVINSSKKAKEFFNMHDLDFANRPPTELGKHVFYDSSDVLLAPYGKYWRSARTMCIVHLLSSKRVRTLRPLRQDEARLMAARVWDKSNHGREAIDLSEALATFSTNVMWRAICGCRLFSANDHIGNGMSFKTVVDQISAMGGKINLGAVFPFGDLIDPQGIKRKMKAVHVAYDSFVENIIQERLRCHDQGRCSDFLDVLLQSDLNKSQIKALILDMSGGGMETTMISMEWAMALLLKHPHVLKRAQEEIDEVVGKTGEDNVGEEHLQKLKFLESVLKETMRLYPAGPLAIPHGNVEETTIFGYRVPKGSTVLINIWAIQRDESVWEEPNEFKPERFMAMEDNTEMKWLPFSAGRRGCPGAAMAMPMMLLGLATLLHQFDWKGYEIDMEEEAGGISIHKKSPLIVSLKRRRGRLTL